MKYEIVIEQGETSYGAYVPELPGCVAVGETADEVKSLIDEAIVFHLESSTFAQVVMNVSKAILNVSKAILVGAMLLIVCSSVSAQDDPGKIVWSNLEKTYTDFKDIKPKLNLEEREWIVWNASPLYFLLYRFDDARKNWVEGEWHVTDEVQVQGPFLLRKGEFVPDVFYSGQFFDWERDKGYFFISQNQERFPVNGRYRITFFYGINMRDPKKFDQYSHSPEFTINGKYPAIK